MQPSDERYAPASGLGGDLGRVQPVGCGPRRRMDCQTLRDWAHRFYAEGPDGLRDYPHAGPAFHWTGYGMPN